MKENKNIKMEKYIIERKTTNEISAIDAFFPVILEQLKKDKELLLNNPDEYYRLHPKAKIIDNDNTES